MKKSVIFCIVIILFVLTISAQNDPSSESIKLLKNVQWLGHASVKITGKNIIYMDPYKITDKQKADIVFITHDHGDHFSINDIKKIQKESTVFIGPSCVTKRLRDMGYQNKNIITVKSSETRTVKNIKFNVVPSYNLTLPNHAREKGYVGYVVKVDKISYYHPGDTDFIPEMSLIKADVAFLPVTAPYTMSPEKAAEAANVIKPKIAIPFHWGTIIGNRGHAERFKKLCRCNVLIMKQRK